MAGGPAACWTRKPREVCKCGLSSPESGWAARAKNDANSGLDTPRKQKSASSRREWPRRVDGRGGPDLNPGNISRPFRVWRNLFRQRVGVLPFSDLSVAVCKRESAGAVVVIGRHIGPKPFSIQKHQEITVVDPVRVFVEEHKSLGRGRLDDLGILSVSVKLPLDLGRVPTVAVHVAVHGSAADARPQNSGTDPGDAPVSGAFINSERLVVIPQQSVWRFEKVDVGGVLRCLQPASDPSTPAVSVGVGHEFVAVVVRIQEPGELKLF